MTKCKGIIGKIFGHKFENLLVKRYVPMGEDNEISANSSHAIARIYTSRETKEYKIICTRCGEEK